MPMLGIMASAISGNLSTASYESIATASPTSGTSISFTSIPSTYVGLQVRWSFINTAATTLSLQLNGSSSAIYDYHGFISDGSTLVATNVGTGQSQIQAQGYQQTVTTYPNVGIMNLINYASTTQNKTIQIFCGADKNAAGGSSQLRSGDWLSTSAVNRIDLYLGTGAYSTGSTFALYGIKG